ncbi:MAG: hypothetical protein ACREL1_00475 [bacterium]
MTEIPDSHVLQVNEGVLDGNGALESATSTGWSIDVHDSQAQVYGLHLVGMETGIVEVETSILQSGIPGSADNNFKILITKGESREVQLTVNPSEKIVTAQPVVGKEDLLSDVEAACQVDLITSRRACEFLTLQAKIIARAVNKQHDEEAKAGLWVFLHALGYSRPSGCRDGDHHDEVKQPALGILQEDAKALLTQIGPPARHFGEKDR